MSRIDFNFQSAYEAKDTVRIAAESMTTEAKNIESLIAQTNEGWTGSGAEAYINYLQHMLSEMKMSASRLYLILSDIEGSINAAQEADRLAREAVEAAAQTNYTPVSSNIHSDAGRNFCTESDASVEKVNAAVDAIKDSMINMFGKSRKKS